MTREELIAAAQEAAYGALPGLLRWDEAGVVARDVLDVADDLVGLNVQDDR